MKSATHQKQQGRSRPVRAKSALFLLIMAAACAGCQTFNLSEEDFQKQQRGQEVDADVGNWVETAGSLGYWGATIGEAAAALSGK